MATTLGLSPLTSSSAQLGQSVIHPASNFSRELLRNGVDSSSTGSWSMSLEKQSSNGGHGMDPVKVNQKGSSTIKHESLENQDILKSAEEAVVESSIDPSSSNCGIVDGQLTEEASEDPVSGSSSITELPEIDAENPIDDSDPKNGMNSFDITGDTEKSSGSAKVSNSCDFVDSGKNSICRGSTSSDVSEDSSSSSVNSSINKPHRANDARSEAIQAIRSQDGMLGLNHFRILRRLGCGDIGSVYLSELTGTKTHFAMKVMDKAALASRKKLVRAQTEREILQTLDHPFLPTLYTHFETEKFSCLVMEFCPGGDLHALRQRQPGKRFSENAARFYVAEVLLALEYLHMLGIIYRDLKPENVLVREDGHVMLSDFDLSLTCGVCPTLVKSLKSSYYSQPDGIDASCITQANCIQPSCFMPRFLQRKSKKEKKTKPKTEVFHHITARPELIAEPTDVRSMSFVGTHEYLAPEIIKGEGHGSAVDWWMFGIFLYELLYGKTPFKGSGNRATLLNVVGQPLRFPETPTVSFAVKDLIKGLLVKDPQQRLAHRRGATEIRQHPFFQTVNWALIRGTNPPEVPKPFITEIPKAPKQDQNVPVVDVKPTPGNYLEIDFF
ncbi:hypothetical protein C5167_026100 [Papaver somniferum]|uniref:serine/threonine-protein kinase D6PKL1-like n=1 Tax=Papaver somniferum TaxID=3469 RepID=UPI000E6F9D17|nr:serine/threonine-protein kinase D6PKL1-like [Papaver somniferum]RZC93342.1 hypothetical protein C5167_026100 [Papaver somniferum]